MSEEDQDFGYPLTGDELRAIITTSPEQRFEYFLDKVNETEQVWTIGAEDELIVLSGDDEEPFIVVFPHPEFGQDWFSTTELEDVDLVAVRTEDFAKEILPSLEDSNIEVLVFPTSEADGTIARAKQLSEILQSSPAD